MKKYKMIVTQEVTMAFYVQAESLEDIEEYAYDVYDQEELDSVWADIVSVEEIGN